MLEYVKALENKDNRDRGRQVLAILEDLGLKAAVQVLHRPEIKNIEVDFTSAQAKKHLLFSAHYDAVEDSPGANDNASGVAVLLELCRTLKGKDAPVKVVFFDSEEAWFRSRWLKLGLLGSAYYVLTHTLSDIAAVYNLECCGKGDNLVVWPVKSNQKSLTVVEAAGKSAEQLNITLHLARIPWWLNSSDHLSFRLRGLHNAATFSMAPAEEASMLENFFSNLNLIGLIKGSRPSLPGFLSEVHTARDSSTGLNEESLQRMLLVLKNIICNVGSKV
jgi:hypothetical protein